MKKLLLFIFVGLLFTQTKAQDISCNFAQGELRQDELSKRTMGIESLGSDKDYFYYLYLPYRAVSGQVSYGSTGNYFIAKFDKDNLKQLAKNEIVLKNDSKNNEVRGIYRLKNSIYLYSTFDNKEHEKHYLFVQNINKETFEVEDNIKKIGEIDYSGIMKDYEPYLFHKISPDSSKILIYYNIENYYDEIVKCGMYVFSDEMELIWKDENVVPKVRKGVFVFQDIKIDNSGTVYIKGINYLDMDAHNSSANLSRWGYFSSDTYYGDLANYVTQIHQYSDGAEEPNCISLRLSNKFIRSLTFAPSENGQLLCAGIYSSSNTVSAKGSFVFNLDMETEEVTNLETEEFGRGFIGVCFNEKQIKKYRKRIDNKQEWDPFGYLLSDIKTDSKGGMYFIAEQYIKGRKVEKRDDNKSYKTIFMRNNMLVTRFGENNKIDRVDTIAKQQYFLTTRQFNSYSLLENEGNLYFIFNNYNPVNTLFRNIELGGFYLVELDTVGYQEREMLKPPLSRDKQILLPCTAMQVNNKELIFSTVSFDFKDYRVNRMTYE